MTIWPAYAAFQEKEMGSLTPGKYADFVVLDQDIMRVPAGARAEDAGAGDVRRRQGQATRRRERT